MDPLFSALTAWLLFLSLQGAELRPFLNPPASNVQIAEAERAIGQSLPTDVLQLYRFANGQRETIRLKDPSPGKYFANLFGGYRFLSLDEAVRSWQGWKPIYDDPRNEDLQYNEFITVRKGHAVHRMYFSPAWLPIAEDGGGNAWAIDLDPPDGGVRGQIIQMGPDEDERRVIANSLTELFLGAAQFIDPKDVHVSDCCGPRLTFEMDWKEPAQLSPEEQRALLPPATRPRINLHLQSLGRWLDQREEPISAQLKSRVRVMLHDYIDLDGAYRLCKDSHKAKVTVALYRDELQTERAYESFTRWQQTDDSLRLLHDWLLNDKLISDSRFRILESIRTNDSGARDKVAKEINLVANKYGGLTYQVQSCTLTESLYLLLTWPIKRLRGKLYERKYAEGRGHSGGS